MERCGYCRQMVEDPCRFMGQVQERGCRYTGEEEVNAKLSAPDDPRTADYSFSRKLHDIED